MKDKAGGHVSDLPAQERGARSTRDVGNAPGKAGTKRAESRSGGRGGNGGNSASSSSSRTDKGSSRALPSPIQALKAAVKKTAGKASRKQGKKPRR